LFVEHCIGKLRSIRKKLYHQRWQADGTVQMSDKIFK